MKAAIVRQAGQTPIYGDFPEPVPAPGDSRITVTAAAISNVARSRASGAHYSSSGEFPLVAGIDGVGRLDDGRRVYFALPRPPYGSMCERTVAPTTQCLPVPDSLDDVMAAAIANPGLSSWVAFTERARLKAGETVLVNGATGMAGQLAVQIAKHLGASKVIATGRNPDRLRALSGVGADVTIQLTEDGDALERSFMAQFAEGIDVVIDYLWGASAERLLIAAAKAGAEAVRIRFVQVGSVSAQEITLPSAVLRASAIELMGSGIGSVALDRLISITGEVLRAAASKGFRIAVDPAPLSEVGQAWSKSDSASRTVLTIDAEGA